MLPINAMRRGLLAVPRITSITTPSVMVPFTSSLSQSMSSATTAGGIQPFHHAFPVHDLDAARNFYGNILKCEEGRSSKTWIDYSLYGHQIVCHFASKTYRCIDYYNDVDKDSVPVPHFGVVLSVDEFKALAERVKQAKISFIVEPHLRFKGAPGEQWTMFFKDPSGNNLEFKAMTNPDNLFAKYFVKE